MLFFKYFAYKNVLYTGRQTNKTEYIISRRVTTGGKIATKEQNITAICA